MEVVKLVAFNRDDFSKVGLQKIREDGNVPGVLYGCGVIKHFVIPCVLLNKLIYTNKKYIINLNLNGDMHQCILKDVQFHPVSDYSLHVDFQKIDDNSNIEINLNIITEGIPNGVRAGGWMSQKKKKLTVYGSPKNIPSIIELNISSLNGGDTLRVKDLKKIKNCTYKNDPSDPIVVVKSPRVSGTETVKKEAA